MYTGNYECLELFVKPDEGKKGSVLLKNVKESTTETKEPKHIYGNWIKFPVSRNAEYEISTQDCTITFAYLSECENIMENGICVLDTTDNYKEMNKEEFLHFIDTKFASIIIRRFLKNASLFCINNIKKVIYFCALSLSRAPPSITSSQFLIPVGKSRRRP